MLPMYHGTPRQNTSLLKVLVILLCVLIFALCYQHYSNQATETILRKDIEYSQKRAQQVKYELDAIQKGLQRDLNMEKEENSKIKSELSDVKQSLKNLNMSQQSSLKELDEKVKECDRNLGECETQSKLESDSCIEEADRLSMEKSELEAGKKSCYDALRTYQKNISAMNEEKSSLVANYQKLYQYAQNVEAQSGQYLQEINQLKQQVALLETQKLELEEASKKSGETKKVQESSKKNKAESESEISPMKSQEKQGENLSDTHEVLKSEIEGLKLDKEKPLSGLNQFDPNLLQEKSHAKSGKKEAESAEFYDPQSVNNDSNYYKEDLRPANWRSQESVEVPPEEDQEQDQNPEKSDYGESNAENEGGEGEEEKAGPAEEDALIANYPHHQLEPQEGAAEKEDDSIRQVHAPPAIGGQGNVAEVDVVANDGQGAMLPPLKESERRKVESGSLDDSGEHEQDSNEIQFLAPDAGVGVVKSDGSNDDGIDDEKEEGDDSQVVEKPNLIDDFDDQQEVNERPADFELLQ